MSNAGLHGTSFSSTCAIFLFFLTSCRCKLKRLSPGYCPLQFRPQSVMIMSIWQEKLLLFTFLSKPQTPNPTSHESKCIAYFFSPPPFYYLPPCSPFPQLRQGGPILWHTPRPHAHTQKPWPASCRRGEAVFTVTPFWRRGLIPLLSGSVYVYVCACLHSHVLLNMFVSLPAQLLNFFGGRQLLKSNSYVYMCCTYVIVCALRPKDS